MRFACRAGHVSGSERALIEGYERNKTDRKNLVDTKAVEVCSYAIFGFDFGGESNFVCSACRAVVQDCGQEPEEGDPGVHPHSHHRHHAGLIECSNSLLFSF